MKIIDVKDGETEQEAQSRQGQKEPLQVVPAEDAPPPDWDDEFQAEVAKRNAATAAARAPIGAVSSKEDPRTMSLPNGGAPVGPEVKLKADAPIVPEQPVFAGKLAERYAEAKRAAGMPLANATPKKSVAESKKKSAKLQDLEATAVLEVVQIKDVTGSTQPRKHFDEAKLNELAESIRSQGLIQPPLLLRVDDKYTVVVGERRIRASKLAGLKSIFALVRTSLTVAEILDAQVAENVLREDLTALEVAEALGQMVAPVEKGGLWRSVDAISEELGKSRVWVYGRLKLLDLCAEGKKELQREGGISASVAEAVARIDSHDQQRKCLAELDALRPWRTATERDDRDQVTVRVALDLIREKYMLDLSKAPFDRKDDLLTAAGSCAACPFNSANQLGDLFATKTRGYCLKADCYKEKCEAAWVKERERAEKRGHKVLSLAKGRELYRGGALKYDGPYVELHGACVDDEKRRTYKALLGIHCPQVTTCPDDTGKAREIIDRAEAIAGLAAAGHKFAKEAQKAREESAGDDAAPASGSSAKEKNRQLELEQKVRDLVTAELVEATVKRVEAKGLLLSDMLAIAEDLVLGSSWDVLAERRGIKGGYQGLTKELAKASDRQLQGMIMEALITSRGAQDQATTAALAKLAGLKMDELEKKVRTSLALADSVEAEARVKASKKKADEKKRDAAKKPKKKK